LGGSEKVYGDFELMVTNPGRHSSLVATRLEAGHVRYIDDNGQVQDKAPDRLRIECSIRRTLATQRRDLSHESALRSR
jgi:hypothetical protein